MIDTTRQTTIHRFTGIPAFLNDVLFCLLLIFSGCYANTVHAEDAGDQEPGSSLSFTISNITSVTGPLMIEVMASEASFQGDEPAIANMILPAQLGEVAVHIDQFPAGEYAIRVMQDLDNNGELNTNMLGLPREPWGMSNNAAGSFGPPKWQDARFTLPANAEQSIKLR